MKALSRLLLLAMLVLSLGLMGCEGDDGDDGAPGAPGAPGVDGVDGVDGATGPAGPPGPSAGDDLDVIATHAVSGAVAVSDLVVTPTGNDLVVTFNVKVDGVNKTGYDAISSDYRFDGATKERRDLSTDGTTATLTAGASGNYTVTIAGGSTAYGTKNSRYLIRVQNGAIAALPSAQRTPGYRALVVFDYPAAPVADLGDTCADCHGQPGNGFHYGYPNSAKTCVVCHDASNRSADTPLLATLIHGIHASEQAMPSGEYTDAATGEVFKASFPTYMLNCSVCHNNATALASISDAAVSGPFCFTCHESMESWEFESGLSFHENYTAATNCAQCHNTSADAAAGGTVAEFHNGLNTERGGLIWEGQDVSVVEGAKFNQQITGITRTADDADTDTTGQLIITWTATYNGTAVNPCNTTASATAPTWQSGFSILRAYGEGDDWTNNGIGTSPGQPVSTNLTYSTANLLASGFTSCANNVATTRINMTNEENATTAVKGVVALQGKPQIVYTPYGTTPISVRAKTPTREFVVASGALPAKARREIVDTALCLKCHVGSLYQHGGSRVDNVDMCVMCHNEASSEQNVRLLDGVDASEAYDGQVGQTYGFKSLLHAVHSANETGKITMIYRTNGVYVWAGEDTEVPNWPGEGPQFVFGSGPGGSGPNGEITRVHNLYHPTYPQRLNNCLACHKTGTFGLPDQDVAVATTIDAGTVALSTATPPTAANLINGNGDDDVLEGPAAAACMSCHQSNEPSDQAALKGHAYQFGWQPAVFPGGRDDVLDLDPAETCKVCHE